MSEFKFEDFDHYLKAYTEDKGLQLFTQDRDYEIRSFKSDKYAYRLIKKNEGGFSFQVFHRGKNQMEIEFDATPDSVAEYLEKK